MHRGAGAGISMWCKESRRYEYRLLDFIFTAIMFTVALVGGVERGGGWWMGGWKEIIISKIINKKKMEIVLFHHQSFNAMHSKQNLAIVKTIILTCTCVHYVPVHTVD